METIKASSNSGGAAGAAGRLSKAVSANNSKGTASLQALAAKVAAYAAGTGGDDWEDSYGVYTPGTFSGGDFTGSAAKQIDAQIMEARRTNNVARQRALEGYARLLGGYRQNRDEGTEQLDVEDRQARSRMGNVLAARGIDAGGGAVMNYADAQGAHESKLAAVLREFQRRSDDAGYENQGRMGQLDEADRTMQNQRAGLIETLRGQLENNAFNRFIQTEGLRANSISSQNQLAAARMSREDQASALAASNRREDAFMEKSDERSFLADFMANIDDFDTLADAERFAYSRGRSLSDYPQLVPDDLKPSTSGNGRAVQNDPSTWGWYPFGPDPMGRAMAPFNAKIPYPY